MADANEETRTTVILGLHKLLLKVHQELFKGCKGAHCPYWKCGMEVGIRSGSSFHGIEEMHG